MADHYTLKDAKRAINNPKLFSYELKRLASLPFYSGYSRYYNMKYENGCEIMAEDWDNLILIDACRHDYFIAQNWIDGKLKTVTSKGKRSWEFMQGNFQGRKLHDTVYITANPHTTKLNKDTFHAVDLLLDRWDDEIGTVQPEDVVKAAVEAHRTYPNKRLIIHFMQPHRPYLGPTADELRERINLVGYNNSSEGIQIWGAVKQGDVSVAEVRKAYSESLDIVLKYVEKLLNELDGKSVVTSDHGEMLGEQIMPFGSKLWGHSEGFDTATLRQVPWLIVDSDQRREITQEAPIAIEQLDQSLVEDRLEALGYK